MTELRTPRLVLRQWRDDDLAPFAALNADPEVMRHFPSVLTRPESDAWVAGARSLVAARGWGLWAVEVLDGAPFVGFVGLAHARFEAHFTPAVEIGWRLAREHWGRATRRRGRGRRSRTRSASSSSRRSCLSRRRPTTVHAG